MAAAGPTYAARRTGWMGLAEYRIAVLAGNSPAQFECGLRRQRSATMWLADSASWHVPPSAGMT